MSNLNIKHTCEDCEGLPLEAYNEIGQLLTWPCPTCGQGQWSKKQQKNRRIIDEVARGPDRPVRDKPA